MFPCKIYDFPLVHRFKITGTDASAAIDAVLAAVDDTEPNDDTSFRFAMTSLFRETGIAEKGVRVVMSSANILYRDAPKNVVDLYFDQYCRTNYQMSAANCSIPDRTDRIQEITNAVKRMLPYKGIDLYIFALPSRNEIVVFSQRAPDAKVIAHGLSVALKPDGCRPDETPYALSPHAVLSVAATADPDSLRFVPQEILVNTSKTGGSLKRFIFEDETPDDIQAFSIGHIREIHILDRECGLIFAFCSAGNLVRFITSDQFRSEWFDADCATTSSGPVYARKAVEILLSAFASCCEAFATGPEHTLAHSALIRDDE